MTGLFKTKFMLFFCLFALICLGVSALAFDNFSGTATLANGSLASNENVSIWDYSHATIFDSHIVGTVLSNYYFLDLNTTSNTGLYLMIDSCIINEGLQTANNGGLRDLNISIADADGDLFCPGSIDVFVINVTDCDNTNASIKPGADEDTCDLVDNDCDGLIDEHFNGTLAYYYDGDGD